MDKINKYQTGVILLAVIVGLLIGHSDFIASFSSNMIVPLLMLMLFGLFLTIDLNQLKTSFLNVKFAVSNIVLNFVWTPLFAYGLGYLFLSDQLPIWIGFVMLMVTPCTDWYLVFTGVAKGNVPLSTAVLPINLVLQVLLLPVYLFIFFGATGNVELSSLLGSIFLVLVVPFVAAYSTKKFFNQGKPPVRGAIGFLENSQVLFLALAVVAMFASEGKNLVENPGVIYSLLVPVLIFFAAAFLIAQIASRVLGFPYEDRASLTLTTMARNSPISLAIAVAAFPTQPLIALSLIIGPLIELPILVLTTQGLLKLRKKK